MNLRSRQAGFSLMELMIGMVLGLIVVSGAVAIYLAASTSYSQVEQSAQMNENSRFAEQVLTDALRHVGFMGEAGPGSIQESVPPLPAIANDCDGETRAEIYEIGSPIYAVTATAAASDPDINCFGALPENNALAGTDILIMKSAVPTRVVDTDDDNVLDPPAGLVLAGKLWLLTNDDVGVMFDGDDTPPTISTGGDVPDGAAWEYRYEVYFIRDFSDGDGKLMPSLSRFVLRESSVGGPMVLEREDLVPGVEDMRIRFGLDTTGGDGDVDLYSTVAEIQASNNWDQIVSIEIAMLVSGSEADPNYTDSNTYELAGFNNVVAPDTREQHRRSVVRANVSLRNIKFRIRGPT
ncbi:MAG: PilW family protein [Halioglobus sp.]